MTTFTSEDREAAAMSMSALELADGVKNFYSHPNQPYFLTQLETALRQQQALIDGADVLIKELQERLREKMAEIGCYKIELKLHKAMIQDLENALRKVDAR